ncbi:MAG: DUF1499 domain-containing protein [Beijerinckiaceae bacterium]
MRRLSPEPAPRLAAASQWLAMAGWGLAALSIVAVRLGGVPVLNGMVLLGAGIVAAVIAIIAACGALARIWSTGAEGTGVASKGLFLALLLLVWPGFMAVTAARLPVMNDISTDVADPPSFGRSRTAMDARGGHVPGEYDRQQGADQQEAYGDLRSVVIEQGAEEVMALVRRAATMQGWQIIDSANPSGRTGTGRIEAVATSFLFRFPDDITIRIRPGANDTRVDVRSVSRVGRHDFGVNARRIQAFVRELEALAAAR